MAVAIRHFGPVGKVVLVVVAALVIVTPRFTLWLRAPLVPVTDNVNAPIEAEDPALRVSVDVAVPPDGGVTGPGRPRETSDGAVPTHE